MSAAKRAASKLLKTRDGIKAGKKGRKSMIHVTGGWPEVDPMKKLLRCRANKGKHCEESAVQ
jgi:hypothetical protein